MGTGIGPGNPGTRADGDRTVATSAVDQRPVPLNSPKPHYTLKAREDKIQGTVSMRILVDKDGLVKQTKILRGLPDGLDEEATRTAFELRFKPAMKDGKPVQFWMMINITFNLR
jgi:protein TonB